MPLWSKVQAESLSYHAQVLLVMKIQKHHVPKSLSPPQLFVVLCFHDILLFGLKFQFSLGS